MALEIATIKEGLLALFEQRQRTIDEAADEWSLMVAEWLRTAVAEGVEDAPAPVISPEPTPAPTPDASPDPEAGFSADVLGGALGSLDYVTDGMALSIGNTPGDVSAYADDIAAAGFKWVRTRLFWRNIETSQGVYNWTVAPNYDRIVDEFNARGIGVLFMLQLTHNTPIYGAGSEPPYDASGRTAFANYAAAAAAHWAADKVAFELGNEPNLDQFFPNDTDNDGTSIADIRNAADNYGALASVVIPAMRAANPSVFVVGPGLAGKGGPYVGDPVEVGAHEFLERMLANGTVALFNRFSCHFYTAESDNPSDTMAAGKAPEDADYQLYKTLLGDPSAKIFNTEHGWRSDDSATQDLLQASYNVRDFLFGLSNNVRFRSWYLWGGASGQDVFYIQNSDTTVASGVLAQELFGFRFSQRYDTGNADQYVLEFRNDAGEVRLVAWKRDATTAAEVSYPFVGTATVVDVLGNTSQLASSGTVITANLDVHPVYVRLPVLI